MTNNLLWNLIFLLNPVSSSVDGWNQFDAERCSHGTPYCNCRVNSV